MLAELGPKAKRLTGTINGHPIRLGLLALGQGEKGIMVNKDICKAAGLRLGQVVAVRLAPDPTPDAVDLPAELAEGLAEWPEAQAGYEQLKTAMKRAVAYHVSSAKQSETRLKRTVQMLQRLAVGAHPFRALPGE
ncbi:YdeI/OmpD-associated family protein [Hymenobacter cellulosilyticus]|uniref:YdeI/OmpD-associated family protein n=1 Tax=Hymenobacter cellulosilyticus TaxID=2932248 RepID=A0A8T9QA76_9BACT|nr:YdeI/OmpD-associated family protein [Hymenobacter cellulosilyticus]UOQ72720.1 YdeI/OmpD-associated family protein [Hymenobacter cellulosilyticus]